MRGYFIDFDDSFAQTIVAYLKRTGLKLDVINHNDKNIAKILNDNSYEYLVLGPGPGVLTDYSKICDFLYAKIFQHKKVVGFCLGHQIIARYFGFELKQYDNPIHGVSFSLSFSRPFVKTNQLQTNVQFYNSWYVEAKHSKYDVIYFDRHENQSICALKTSFSISYQFHPESVGTSCPEEFFDAVHNFLYNEVYEQKSTEIQRSIR